MTYSITIMIREEKNFNQIIMIKKKIRTAKCSKGGGQGGEEGGEGGGGGGREGGGEEDRQIRKEEKTKAFIKPPETLIIVIEGLQHSLNN